MTDVLTGADSRWMLVRWYNGMPNQAETAVRDALPPPSGSAAGPAAAAGPARSDRRCAVETTMDPRCWRHPDVTTAGWLRYLVSVGYEPADVERLILDHANPDDQRPDDAEDPSDTDAG